MKLIADSGLWSTGPTVSPPPAVAVLEVSGAVLAWTIDDSRDALYPRITFTDVVAAEWLWRLLGTSGHVAVVSALDGRAPAEAIDIDGIDMFPESVQLLRRLAVGHWLRRWWPSSARDGIAGLDRSLLDGEVALLTSAAQDYFTADTLDSDVVELLSPLRTSLVAYANRGDPRVVDLVRRCTELADESGAWDSSEVIVAVEESDSWRRGDFALAAGGESGKSVAAIARGLDSVNWMAVPPGTFDAAEETIAWSIEGDGIGITAVVSVATLGPASPAGIEVRVRSGVVSGVGVLDARGRASVTLVDENRRALAETPAWNHDWSRTTVRIGADVPESAEPSRTRERIRDVARRRLANPGADAYLAELLAAESDY